MSKEWTWKCQSWWMRLRKDSFFGYFIDNLTLDWSFEGDESKSLGFNDILASLSHVISN